MPDRKSPTTAPPRDEQRVEITKHIRVLWGADDGVLTGWAVWDDFQDDCPVYRTRDEAIAEARELAREYADGER